MKKTIYIFQLILIILFSFSCSSKVENCIHVSCDKVIRNYDGNSKAIFFGIKIKNNSKKTIIINNTKLEVRSPSSVFESNFTPKNFILQNTKSNEFINLSAGHMETIAIHPKTEIHLYLILFENELCYKEENLKTSLKNYRIKYLNDKKHKNIFFSNTVLFNKCSTLETKIRGLIFGKDLDTIKIPPAPSRILSHGK